MQILLSSLCVLLTSLAPLTADPSASLHQIIAPAPEEVKWLEIDWQTDLPAAQKLASAQGKPIFLWQMDGHPLGCV
jgi:hypothetical protein